MSIIPKTVFQNIPVVASKKKKTSSEQHVVSRPIIAICNDMYSSNLKTWAISYIPILCRLFSHSPSLRSLKPLALLLNVPPLDTARLATRLHQARLN